MKKSVILRCILSGQDQSILWLHGYQTFCNKKGDNREQVCALPLQCLWVANTWSHPAGQRSWKCKPALSPNKAQKAQGAAKTKQLKGCPGSQERGQPSNKAGVPLPARSHDLRNLTDCTSRKKRGKYPALALKIHFCIGSVNYLGVWYKGQWAQSCISHVVAVLLNKMKVPR